MARYYYNSAGNLRGVSYSKKERAEQNAGAIYFYLLCIVAAPFYPLYFLSTSIYKVLADTIGLHSLFSGILAVAIFAAGLYGLWASRVFRCVYFGVTTLVVSVIVFRSTLSSNDAVWATFFTILTLAAGLGLTYLVDLLDRTFRPAAAQDTAAGYGEPATHHDHVAPSLADLGTEQETSFSFPLNDDEAALLISKVSDAAWDLLEAMSSGAVEPGFASITWKDAKAITKHRNWPEFVETTLAGLHGLLRELTGDSHAVLILDGDDLYTRGQRPVGGKVLVIEGPAVGALQREFAEAYRR